MEAAQIIRLAGSERDEDVISAYDAIFADTSMRNEMESSDLTCCEYVEVLKSREAT